MSILDNYFEQYKISNLIIVLKPTCEQGIHDDACGPQVYLGPVTPVVLGHGTLEHLRGHVDRGA